MGGAWEGGRGTVRPWTGGPWSLELRDDEIADLAFDGRTVLRSIRAVVRDQDWDTPEWAVEDAVVADRSLVLTLRVDDLGMKVAGTVRVDATDTALTVSFEAVAEEEAWTNRTGLVVLHPPRLAGTPLTVTHPDGADEATGFPREVRPHQPVVDIGALRWEADGLDVSVAFSGDVFEMEDQRNWSDASYKTYSRPLSLPFPYRIAAGESVTQSVVVTVRATGPRPAAGEADRIVLRRGGTFPALALGASTAPDPAPEAAPLGDAVLVELDLASPGWPAALARAAGGGLPLDVRLVLAGDAPEDVRAVVEALRPHEVARIAAFWANGPARHVSDDAATALLRDALAAAGRRIPVVGGSRAHFTELNREHHRLPGDLDGLVFSTTPLFHSRSTAQLEESVAIQRLLARQAVGLAAGVPVHIGPVTLRPRFNDVATAPADAPRRADLRDGYGAQLLDADDARQDAPELAAWTVASAAALAVPGVGSLTFYEEWGPRGVRTGEGRPRPVLAAVEDLASLRGGTAWWADSLDGVVWALGAETGDQATIVLAHLGAEERRVEVELPLPGRPVLDAVVPGRSVVRLRHDLPVSRSAPDGS